MYNAAHAVLPIAGVGTPEGGYKAHSGLPAGGGFRCRHAFLGGGQGVVTGLTIEGIADLLWG